MNTSFFTRKQNFFDSWAPNYDLILTTPFYQAVHKRMLNYAELLANGHILDLGCGTGKLLQRIGKSYPTVTGVGLDLSPKMIAEAKAKNLYREHLTFTVGNAENQPFEENTFDAAFNTISFLHYPNPEKVLGEVQRVLKPGGKFYLADYGKGELLPCSSIPFSPGGLHFYSRSERAEMGSRVGLELLAHHYLMFGVLLTIWQKPSC